MPRAGNAGQAVHVLTLTPFFPSAENEVSGCFVAEVIEQLRLLGVESTVIASSPIYYPRRQTSSAAAAEWVRYCQIPGNFGLSTAGKLLYARLLGRVRKLHGVRPIDVIHAHAALPCGHAAALLSRHFNIPFVVTVHGLDVFNSCFTSGASVRWRRKVSTDVYRAAHSVICISEKVQRLVQEGMSRDVRTTVVYNGTNTDFFSPTPSVPPRYRENEILIVGDLKADKGHELALRAIGQIEASFPDLSCRIIGDGAERERLEALTRQLGIAQRVRFEGRRGRKEVADAMRSCSLFLLPSRYEGLGCVYLEAMACGKPVIACRGQGIDEIVEHGKNGWLIPSWILPSDGVDELARGLTALLHSPDLRARLGASGRETVLNGLTLSHQAQRLAEIYGEAIA